MSVEETMVSTEVLRKTSALLRKRAGAATKGPWKFGEFDGGVTKHSWVVYAAEKNMHGKNEQVVTEYGIGADGHEAEYVASMHPDIGLALADVLDRAADDHDETPCPVIDAVLVLAKKYLRDSL